MQLYGVDFTSSPRPRKPITVAAGRLDGAILRLEALSPLPDWDAFDALLRRPGPWLGGFDFPFGLPREAVSALGWPLQWAALVQHCAALGRAGFRARLDAYRNTRLPGNRYAHRRTDLPARSHSPLKLVNPPVGLMFLEGMPRLLAAGVDVPGLHHGDPARIAIEAYPGLLARAITRASYKSDDRKRQTEQRRIARENIVAALRSGAHRLDLGLAMSDAQAAMLVEDASGDTLDAALALVQAAWCARAGAPRFGLPDEIDPLEGWIATVPPPDETAVA